MMFWIEPYIELIPFDSYHDFTDDKTGKIDDLTIKIPISLIYFKDFKDFIDKINFENVSDCLTLIECRLAEKLIKKINSEDSGEYVTNTNALINSNAIHKVFETDLSEYLDFIECENYSTHPNKEFFLENNLIINTYTQDIEINFLENLLKYKNIRGTFVAKNFK
jgi:hypothetical protein